MVPSGGALSVIYPFIYLSMTKANAGVTLAQVGSWLSLVGFQVGAGPRLTDNVTSS